MKTQGEIEAAICEGVSRFEQDYMGRGPKAIHAHLIDNLLIVRLQGVLTAAEQHLVNSLPPEKGRNLLKQVRTHLIEAARPVMETMVREATGVGVISLHHDISTVTGEELIIFTLEKTPQFRVSSRQPVTWSKVDRSATGDGMFDVACTSTGLMISEFVPHAAVPGDYNGDGTVDAADYVV